jgi:hypothetical protein
MGACVNMRDTRFFCKQSPTFAVAAKSRAGARGAAASRFAPPRRQPHGFSFADTHAKKMSGCLFVFIIAHEKSLANGALSGAASQRSPQTEPMPPCFFSVSEL